MDLGFTLNLDTVTSVFVWSISSLLSLSDPCGIECCSSVFSYMMGLVLMFFCPVMTTNV